MNNCITHRIIIITLEIDPFLPPRLPIGWKCKFAFSLNWISMLYVQIIQMSHTNLWLMSNFNFQTEFFECKWWRITFKLQHFQHRFSISFEIFCFLSFCCAQITIFSWKRKHIHYYEIVDTIRQISFVKIPYKNHIKCHIQYSNAFSLEVTQTHRILFHLFLFMIFMYETVILWQ